MKIQDLTDEQIDAFVSDLTEDELNEYEQLKTSPARIIKWILRKLKEWLS